MPRKDFLTSAKWVEGGRDKRFLERESYGDPTLDAGEDDLQPLFTSGRSRWLSVLGKHETRFVSVPGYSDTVTY